jgi:hypothetical protein
MLTTSGQNLLAYHFPISENYGVEREAYTRGPQTRGNICVGTFNSWFNVHVDPDGKQKGLDVTICSSTTYWSHKGLHPVLETAVFHIGCLGREIWSQDWEAPVTERLRNLSSILYVLLQEDFLFFRVPGLMQRVDSSFWLQKVVCTG